jgi:hypothetical protein
MSEIVNTKYKCTECGESDSDHQIYTPHPPALICWNCRAGRALTPVDQSAKGVGMIPVSHPRWFS